MFLTHTTSGLPVDGVARAMLWDLSKQYGFERSDKWYEHVPKNFEDNENLKLLWKVWIPREATGVRPLRSEFIKGSFRSRTTNLDSEPFCAHVELWPILDFSDSKTTSAQLIRQKNCLTTCQKNYFTTCQ